VTHPQRCHGDAIRTSPLGLCINIILRNDRHRRPGVRLLGIFSCPRSVIVYRRGHPRSMDAPVGSSLPPAHRWQRPARDLATPAGRHRSPSAGHRTVSHPGGRPRGLGRGRPSMANVDRAYLSHQVLNDLGQPLHLPRPGEHNPRGFVLFSTGPRRKPGGAPRQYLELVIRPSLVPAIMFTRRR